MFSAHSHSHLLPGFEIREYVTPSLLKERVHLLPRKNNYLEPCPLGHERNSIYSAEEKHNEKNNSLESTYKVTISLDNNMQK